MSEDAIGWVGAAKTDPGESNTTYNVEGQWMSQWREKGIWMSYTTVQPMAKSSDPPPDHPTIRKLISIAQELPPPSIKA